MSNGWLFNIKHGQQTLKDPSLVCAQPIEMLAQKQAQLGKPGHKDNLNGSIKHAHQARFKHKPHCEQCKPCRTD